MVLLTSSAVSVFISSSVVCTFTFLLFLSGYVLQQRTVRSLQEAIRRAPEPRPVPPLPAVFQNQENETIDFVLESPIDVPELHVIVSDGSAIPKSSENSQPAVEAGHEGAPPPGSAEYGVWLSQVAQRMPAAQSLAADTMQSREQHLIASNDEQSRAESTTPEGHLAYIFSLPQPMALCSALVFTKWQRQFTTLPTKPGIILLYPATWELESAPSYTAAIAFMREIQEEYNFVYHPVPVSTAWNTESQLLGEFQRTRWDFDRIMYLRQPGLALDPGALDAALRFSSLKSWAPITASAGSNPDILLWSATKGLLTPRSDLRKLTASVVASHDNRRERETGLEAVAQNAAYVLLDEQDLERHRGEKEWDGGLLGRFERERQNVCRGRGLLGDEANAV